MTEQVQEQVQDQAANQWPMTRTVSLLPETLDLIQRAAALESLSVQIDTADQRVVAADQLAKIKGLFKAIDEKRAEMKRPFDEGSREVQAFFKPRLDALTTTEGAIKRAMIKFDDEQERIARENAAKEAERVRKEQEALVAKAEKLEARGKSEQAEAVRENAAAIVTAPVAVAEPIKTAGTSWRVTYSAKVTDLSALVKAVAEGRVPLNVLAPDQKVLDGMAKALKESFKGMYPGVELVSEAGLSQRAANPF